MNTSHVKYRYAPAGVLRRIDGEFTRTGVAAGVVFAIVAGLSGPEAGTQAIK